MQDGDEWKLTDYDRDSQNYKKEFIFDFSFISYEDIKYAFKMYLWGNYCTQNKTLSKLSGDLWRFKHFNKFAQDKGIKELCNMDNRAVNEYISYLRLKISNQTMKKLSYAYQKQCLVTLKTLIHWCQLHLPSKVPNKEIFTGNEYRGASSKLKIDFIPDDILNRINDALISEDNVYVKYAILILEWTGIRIGDMLLLKRGSIKAHSISGYTMEWFDHKSRKMRPSMPVTPECAAAMKKLEDYTEHLREDADEETKNYLFIHKPKTGKLRLQTKIIKQTCIRDWFSAFISKNNILDSNGELYNLTAHKFRRTLATDMLSKGTNIKVIQEVLGHTRVATTSIYYSDVKDKERAETFKNIGIIGSIGNIGKKLIPNEAERKWFMDNKDGIARMCDGFCTKPMESGVLCTRLLKRQKCYTCSRYITTLEDLETHKSNLKELEMVLERNIYGEHYAAHFTSTVAVIKEIIRRLETIKDAGK